MEAVWYGALSSPSSQIRVLREKQRAVLTIDNRYFKHTTSPKQADILDVLGMLYIGGLPVNYTTKRIGPVRP